MKHILYTALLTSAIALSSHVAKAELLNSGLGTGITGQVGVSTPIVNTDTNVHTRTDTSVRVRDGDTYESNSEEREVREHSIRDEDGNARVYSEQRTRTRVYAPDISPAAGNYNIPPSARVMGGIQGGASYND